MANGTQMSDGEAREVIMNATQLRSNLPYRNAFRSLQGKGANGAAQMASAAEESDDLAAIRLLIGTWNAIAISTDGFNEAQWKRFFSSQPVSLMWKTLSHGVAVIRTKKGDKFAGQFEALYNKYQPEAGKAYISEEAQAVTALFA
jgi:hypothetical protein